MQRAARVSSVLILGIWPQTLAVARSLSRAGFHVVLGRSGPKSCTEASRHVHEVWLHAQFSDPRFKRMLLDLLDSRPDIQTLFPIAEAEIDALHNIEELPSRSINVVAVAPALFNACLDKSVAGELGRRAGLRVPASAVARDQEELAMAVAEIGFPVIIKSVRTESAVFGRKAFIVFSKQEFDEHFEQWPAKHGELLVQAYVAGPMESADYVAESGTLTAYCETRNLRTDWPDGTGFTVEFETVEPSEDFLGATQSFVSANQYTGPGLLQCIRCEKTGQLFFVENNPRLAAGIAHLIACGLDIPLSAVHATNREQSDTRTNHSATQYEIANRAHWLERDLEGWLNQWKHLSMLERIAWMRCTVIAFLRADCHINWQWRDPLPSVCIYSRFAKRLVLAGVKRMLAIGRLARD